MAPTVIKWTDPNVPVLSRRASALIEILDFCLPQRGWEKSFSGLDKAVYRAGSGERKSYRVLNDGSFYYSSTSYLYCHAKVTAYDTMSDIDTGAGKWAETYFILSDIGAAVARPWMCIFDEKTVLLITIPNKTTGLTDLATANSFLVGFGETIPALPGQTARSFLAGHISSGAIYSPSTNLCPLSCAGTYALNAGWGRMHCNRSLDGTRLAIPAGLISNGGVTDPDTRAPFGKSSTIPYSYPFNGALLYARPMLDDGIALGMGDYIPHLYYPCMKGNSFNSWGEYSADGNTFIAVRVIALYSVIITVTDPSYLGAVLINISGD